MLQLDRAVELPILRRYHADTVVADVGYEDSVVLGVDRDPARAFQSFHARDQAPLRRVKHLHRAFAAVRHHQMPAEKRDGIEPWLSGDVEDGDLAYLRSRQAAAEDE